MGSGSGSKQACRFALTCWQHTCVHTSWAHALAADAGMLPALTWPSLLPECTAEAITAACITTCTAGLARRPVQLAGSACQTDVQQQPQGPMAGWCTAVGKSFAEQADELVVRHAQLGRQCSLCTVCAAGPACTAWPGPASMPAQLAVGPPNAADRASTAVRPVVVIHACSLPSY